MNIVEVNDKRSGKEFLKVPKVLYKDDPHWACPLDMQIESIFDPGRNVFFGHGEATRWVLKDDNGALAGRIAAFINNKKAFNFDQPTGGIGFFECINDKGASTLLFDKAKMWLIGRGMEAMDGPVNFGENDIFWGLLTEGFMHQGYGMQYNFPYYKDLFEDYGFEFYFEQVSNHLDIRKPFPERFWKIAEWVANKPDYSCRHFTFKDSDIFISDLKEIYDDAWSFHENFTPIDTEDLRRTLGKAKPIINEEFIWFAYHKDEPIAFLIMFPDINQILKHLNGSLNLWNKIKFVYLRSRKYITRARIIIMGVKPKFQKAGIESAIFWHLGKVMKRKPHYTEIELSWVGDFNPKMRALHESVGAVFAKRHVTYRCLFKEEAEHHRSSIIPRDTKETALKREREAEKQGGDKKE